MICRSILIYSLIILIGIVLTSPSPSLPLPPSFPVQGEAGEVGQVGRTGPAGVPGRDGNPGDRGADGQPVSETHTVI